MGIIKSLLDTDFYKLTMMQAIFHNYTNVHVKYRFYWRNWDDMTINMDMKSFFSQILLEINNLSTLRFSDDELEYLKSIPFFTDDFIEFLRMFELNNKYIKFDFLEDGKYPLIEIEGPWLNTILFETPLLAIISEIYTKQCTDNYDKLLKEDEKRIDNEIDLINRVAHYKFNFGDFSTRRRGSFEIQRRTISRILTESGNNHLIGTSNVHLAKNFNIKPLGTHAHEWFQAHQSLDKLINSQKTALQKWADEFRGDLGIALSDTLGFNAFLVDFDKYFSKLFDGCRHDSGPPVAWGEKLIEHYKKLGIDPKTKTALFSNNLDIRFALNIFDMLSNRINTAFGIGTKLTNPLFTPPQIVLKMVECEGLPVAKLPDSSSKSSKENTSYEESLRKMIDYKLEKGV